MKRIINLSLGLLIIAVLFTLQVKADVKLPAIFGDNMVLQQQSEVAVWGWSQPGKKVSVSGSWNNKSYSAQSDSKGYWKVKVQTPAAGYTPYTLTISDGKAVHLKNILIGEVWLCSGQSNMEMPMKGFNNQPIEGGPDAIANSYNKGIRCFTVKKVATTVPQDDCEGTWEIAGPETTPEFTATGYFFGRLLNKALDVPIGLIHSSWGGSRIEAWMTPSSLKDIPGKAIPQTDADIQIPNQDPTVLYKGMLRPLIGFGMRGTIWYQGESNHEEPAVYVKKFDRMVHEWRNLWDLGEFPFYYCQIAPFRYGDNYNSAYMREAQAKGMEIANTGMAVIMDAESPECIHPPKKKDAGERMALWALANTYGMKKMHYRSPEVKSFATEGRVAVITFDYTGVNGLTSHGKEIQKFMIAGANKRFYPAKAALANDKVYLFSPYVSEPVAVRYCFDDTSATEIFTVEGNLPLSSFRTDDW